MGQRMSAGGVVRGVMFYAVTLATKCSAILVSNEISPRKLSTRLSTARVGTVFSATRRP